MLLFLWRREACGMSVVKQIFERERIDGRNYRKNCRILRKLILQKSAKYKKVWQIHSRSHILYEEKRLYLDNYKTCYACNGLNGFPGLLYKKSANQGIEYKNALLCSVNVDNLEPSMIKFQGYQPHLLVLTSNNLLQRVHLDTGEVLQSVYLSRKYKFKYLSWDEILETVVIKSTNFKNEDGGQVSWLALAVFQVYPFQLIAMFEINKKIFGNDVLDVNISENKLISYHRKGRICFYSFPRILERFATKNIKLGDIYEDDVVGEHPLGIPCNVRITECPDVLFDVAKSEEHCVVIGGFPWHYIIAYMPNNGDMSVFDMQNNKEAINGRLNLVQDPTYTGEKAWFHWDESGRIIHTGPNKMRMLKMKQSSTNSEVVELFNINMNNNATQRSPGPTFTSSGRVVTPRVFDSSLVAWPGLETLKGVEHENELDLLIVVSTDEDHKGHVCYHDNDTGEMYKVVTLEGRWEEHLDYDITVDLDTIWCIVKNRGVFECSFYKLSREMDVT